jgi:hypothetical protein
MIPVSRTPPCMLRLTVSLTIRLAQALAGKTDPSNFDLPQSTRNTLSAILVVHPVAAFITLIMFILAVTSHFHSPSHSARYLLLLFILSIVDLLVCLLAFLIDVLLFAPHMAWGSYIVLAATILVAIGSLVSCAMRRTIVNFAYRERSEWRYRQPTTVRNL